MSKIILKNKKKYFNAFQTKNTFKNNRYYILKHPKPPLPNVPMVLKIPRPP